MFTVNTCNNVITIVAQKEEKNAPLISDINSAITEHMESAVNLTHMYRMPCDTAKPEFKVTNITHREHDAAVQIVTFCNAASTEIIAKELLEDLNLWWNAEI